MPFFSRVQQIWFLQPHMLKSKRINANLLAESLPIFEKKLDRYIFLSLEELIYITTYFRLQVCLSFRLWVCGSQMCHTLRFSIVSQNVPNKSSLVCVQSEKYTFLVTLRPLEYIMQGKAKPSTLHYQAKRSRTAYNKTHLSVHHLPSAVSVPSSCVCQHTQNVPAKPVLPIHTINNVGTCACTCLSSNQKIVFHYPGGNKVG